MRAYRLHNGSWSRIVTHRVRRPTAIVDRLSSRRRLDQPIPSDGKLVMLACNQTYDPRTGDPVDRRELLDRIIEALSIPEVDGVIASADLLEELTLLNVLEHRLAFCAASSDQRLTPLPGGATCQTGIGTATILTSNFDGALLGQQWRSGADGHCAPPRSIAADVAELATNGVPVIVELSVVDATGQDEFDTSWVDWIGPLRATTSSIATGAGVWLTMPAITGLAKMADATGFPVLVRDTKLPIQPLAWQNFFETDLPLTIRGIAAGASALFPLEGSVAEATATIARSVRS